MGMESFKTENKKMPSRLWLANEIGLKLVVKDIKISGKENLNEIPKGEKVIVMTTHMTDFDMLVAIHALACDLDLVVMNQSIHHKFWGEQGEKTTNIGLQIAGKKNFLPIDFTRDDSGKKSPDIFNPENFRPAEKALNEGKAVMVAAHNPSQKPVQNLDDIKGGYGGVYLALLTGAYILPTTVVLDRAAGMYAPNLQIAKNLTGKPNASISIGKPFKLEKVEGIERFSELTKKRKSGTRLREEEIKEFSKLADTLREKSKEVMQKMSEQITK